MIDIERDNIDYDRVKEMAEKVLPGETLIRGRDSRVNALLDMIEYFTECLAGAHELEEERDELEEERDRLEEERDRLEDKVEDLEDDLKNT